MALPLLAIAYPVLHSSGAWIAYAGSGYLAGTLSSTWVGALILGNAGLFASVGLISGAGIWAAASGGLATAATTATAAISVGAATVATSAGAGLSTIGLGSVAARLGIAPVATFLGLSPVGWAVTGSTIAITAAMGLYFKSTVLDTINTERSKGGLAPITLRGIIAEIRTYDRDAMLNILQRLAETTAEIEIDPASNRVRFGFEVYAIDRLKLLVQKDGSEAIVYVPKLGSRKVIYRLPSAPDAS